MAEKQQTAAEDIYEQGQRAKEEHAAKHGDASPTSAAATAEECAALGKSLGFGTYAADESVDAPDPTGAKAQAPAENKAQRAPEKK